MAELSAETNAIIERLRAEGDLVRNSGTNSIRSVKIQLDRFDGLFKCMCNNLTEQTEMLRAQMGIQEARFEAEKRQQDFDNLKKEQEKKDDSDRDANNRKAAEERDAKLIDSLSGMMSLKNLALGAGGLFLGYNLLKGAIDQQFNGAFSNMERGISEFNPAVITETFNRFGTTITTLETTIGNLNTTIEGIQTEFENMKENLTSYSFWLNMAWEGLKGAMGLWTGYKILQLLERNGLLPKRRVPDLDANQQRVNTQRTIADAEAAEAERLRQAEIERQRRIEDERLRRNQRISEFNRNMARRIAGPAPNVMSEGPAPLRNNGTPNNVVDFRTARTTPGFNGTRMTAPGQMYVPTLDTPPAANISTAPVRRPFRPAARDADMGVGRNGNPLTALDPDAQINESQLQRALNRYNDAIPPKYKAAILKIFRFLSRMNIVFKVADTIALIAILTSGASSDEIDRMLARHIGGLIGGAGGAVLGGMLGTFGGPFAWITVPAGGLGGAILGSYGGEWVGLKILEWALNETPSQAEIAEIQALNQSLILPQQSPGSGRAAGQMGFGRAGDEYSALDALTEDYASGALGMPASGIAASNQSSAAGALTSGPISRGGSYRRRLRLQRMANGDMGVEAQMGLLDVLIEQQQQQQELMQSLQDYLATPPTVVIRGGDTTVAPVVNNTGGNMTMEAATIIGGHMDRNMNTYASGPYPGVVYD